MGMECRGTGIVLQVSFSDCCVQYFPLTYMGDSGSLPPAPPSPFLLTVLFALSKSIHNFMLNNSCCSKWFIIGCTYLWDTLRALPEKAFQLWTLVHPHVGWSLAILRPEPWAQRGNRGALAGSLLLDPGVSGHSGLSPSSGTQGGSPDASHLWKWPALRRDTWTLSSADPVLGARILFCKQL